MYSEHNEIRIDNFEDIQEHHRILRVYSDQELHVAFCLGVDLLLLVHVTAHILFVKPLNSLDHELFEVCKKSLIFWGAIAYFLLSK